MFCSLDEGAFLFFLQVSVSKEYGFPLEKPVSVLVSKKIASYWSFLDPFVFSGRETEVKLGSLVSFLSFYFCFLRSTISQF